MKIYHAEFHLVNNKIKSYSDEKIKIIYPGHRPAVAGCL